MQGRGEDLEWPGGWVHILGGKVAGPRRDRETVEIRSELCRWDSIHSLSEVCPRDVGSSKV